MRGIITGAALALVLAVGPMTVSVAASGSASGWTVDASKNPTAPGGALAAVACPTIVDCMAVGSYIDREGKQEPLAEQWNGASWTLRPAARPANQVGAFTSVACTTLDSCTAVGDAYASDGTQITLAEAWNGTGWTVQATPSPAGAAASQFSGVACGTTTTCTAVGSSTDGDGNQMTLAEQWSAGAWAIQATPNPAGEQSGLNSVACASSSACSAVGGSLPTGAGVWVSFAEESNGASWTIPPLASAGLLYGVSCVSANACFAAGQSRGRDPGTQTWNGIHWRTLPNLVRVEGNFSAVSCTALNACTAVGAKAVARWNGTAWTVESLAPTPENDGIAATGVACTSANACTLVGDFFANDTFVTAIERWNGSAWAFQPSPDPASAVDVSRLSAVSCASLTQCMAVGSATNAAGETALAERWNGSAWSITPTVGLGPKEETGLVGISCTSADMCIAVGNDDQAPLAEVWNGTSWAMQTLPTGGPADLLGVSCASATSCSAVGFTYVPNGSQNEQVPFVAQWDGTSWAVRALSQPVDAIAAQFDGVSCTATGDCLAVGYQQITSLFTESTLAEQWNGTAWTVLSMPALAGSADGELKSVACSGSDCTAVGDSDNVALVEQWNGASWTIQTTPNPVTGATLAYYPLEAVSCISATDCTAVGAYQAQGGPTTTLTHTLADHWDGATWVIQPTTYIIGGGWSEFNGVSCAGASTCTAVGETSGTLAARVTLAEHYAG